MVVQKRQGEKIKRQEGAGKRRGRKKMEKDKKQKRRIKKRGTRWRKENLGAGWGFCGCRQGKPWTPSVQRLGW